MKDLAIEAALPEWTAPSNLKAARTVLLKLGKTLHEHAYLIGKHLAWVKTEVGHGQFSRWVESNLWLSQRTAQRFLAFTDACDKAQSLLEYQPGKNDIVSYLPQDGSDAIRRGEAIELVKGWRQEASPELLKAQEFAAEFDEKRDKFLLELSMLQARLKSAGELREVAEIGKRAGELVNEWTERKLWAEWHLGKILNSISKEDLSGFLAFANLPEIQRVELVVQRVAELLKVAA